MPKTVDMTAFILEEWAAAIIENEWRNERAKLWEIQLADNLAYPLRTRTDKQRADALRKWVSRHTPEFKDLARAQKYRCAQCGCIPSKVEVRALTLICPECNRKPLPD